MHSCHLAQHIAHYSYTSGEGPNLSFVHRSYRSLLMLFEARIDVLQKPYRYSSFWMETMHTCILTSQTNQARESKRLCSEKTGHMYTLYQEHRPCWRVLEQNQVTKPSPNTSGADVLSQTSNLPIKKMKEIHSITYMTDSAVREVDIVFHLGHTSELALCSSLNRHCRCGFRCTTVLVLQTFF